MGLNIVINPKVQVKRKLILQLNYWLLVTIEGTPKILKFTHFKVDLFRSLIYNV